MKHYNLGIVIMIIAISMPLVVACSSNDEKDASKIVEGINLTTGKKIVEIQVANQIEYNRKLPEVYKVEYDSKGRLSRVLYQEQDCDFDPYTGKSSDYYYTGELTEVAIVDYDLRFVKTVNYFTRTHGFVLNQDGYISLIGNISLNYDNNGYLVGTDEPDKIGSLAYEGNDLIKASISNITRDKMALFYVSYGNLDNQGDLYIRILASDDKRKWDNETTLNRNNIIFLIAYQSGLFGKVVKSFINLTSKNEASSLFEYDDDRCPYSGKITFKCE